MFQAFYKKLGIAVLLVGCIVLVISFAGREALRSSSVYGEALLEVEKRYGVSRADLAIPLFNSLTFAEGESAGIARFILCTPREDCYQINANKNANSWKIDTVRK